MSPSGPPRARVGAPVDLVLASASPRRLELLRRLGLEPQVVPSSVDESAWPGEDPAAHVERLALEKARSVAGDHPGALVVGGDTVVVDDGTILGKPEDGEDAARMLRALAGRTHEVVTGLAVLASAREASAVARARVRFRAFDDATAEAYVATGEPLDKAGAYGIQGMGAALVEAVDGDYYAVVGFPVAPFVELLPDVGFRWAFGRIERLDPTSAPAPP